MILISDTFIFKQTQMTIVVCTLKELEKKNLHKKIRIISFLVFDVKVAKIRTHMTELQS